MPPTTVIEDDVVDPGGEDPTANSGDVEQGDPLFDPQEDGIDFYESLEGMLTEVRNAVVVGPTSDFGSNREIPVLADGGAGASVRADRGPILVRGFDSERAAGVPPRRLQPRADHAQRHERPERDPFLPARRRARPLHRAGAGGRRLQLRRLQVPRRSTTRRSPTASSSRRPRARSKRDELAVASYNVENLDGLDPQARYDRVADQIVGNLRAPDILSLEEIQDNDGAASPAPTSADVTHQRLIEAIVAAGGPRYDYRQIDPAPPTPAANDGGEPNGNIRVSFLFRTDVRDLRFVDRPGGNATTPTEPVAGPGGTAQLTLSPGRVDPTNPVFNNSRKPLAAEFRYRGKPLFLVGNHFASKGGDDPIFGRFQEPRRSSELPAARQRDRPGGHRARAGRRGQHASCASILDIDSRARVVVLGDLNDFEFSETVQGARARRRPRRASSSWTCGTSCPQDERYSLRLPGQRPDPGPHPRQPGAAARRAARTSTPCTSTPSSPTRPQTTTRRSLAST